MNTRNGEIVPDNDDDVRWIEAESMQGAPTGDASADASGSGSDDESPDMGDLFADPDPLDTFHFEWTVPVPLPACKVVPVEQQQQQQQQEDPKDLTSPSNSDNSNSTKTKTVRITLSGHKAELGQTLHSTGLTLWRASELLCNYMILRNANAVANHTCRNNANTNSGTDGTMMTMEQKDVLELGAGLGLCGILAHHLQAANVVLTDGDTDALKFMRSNVAANCHTYTYTDGSGEMKNVKQGSGTNASMCASSCDGGSSSSNSSASSIQCRQLVWGDNERLNDLRRQFEKGFHLVLGADIIYVEEILDPLFQSVQRLLAVDGQFWLAYARRNVKIDLVLETATRHGFSYETPDDTEGVFVFRRVV
jgi:predicted nicotinamide N-methyase